MGKSILRREGGRGGGSDRQHMARVIEFGAQRREPLVLHQHEKVRLGAIGLRHPIEAGRAVLDRIDAIAGNRLAGRQQHARQRFGAQSFDRVAVDRLDDGHGFRTYFAQI